ncbi:MAG: hypothetical protein IPL97_06875 [Niastella sp.]|nr:hypothetical protein [Niastella sp.]
MKYLFFIFMAAFICCLLSCKKNNTGITLSNEEKKLQGHWELKKQIIEEPGQLPIINYINSPINCFMEFNDSRAPLEDPGSPIFSNAKSVQDYKDCTTLMNGWKIGSDGKLLLASLDTLYADILYVTTDSLAIKVPSHNNHNIIITYGLTK